MTHSRTSPPRFRRQCHPPSDRTRVTRELRIFLENRLRDATPVACRSVIDLPGERKAYSDRYRGLCVPAPLVLPDRVGSLCARALSCTGPADGCARRSPAYMTAYSENEYLFTSGPHRGPPDKVADQSRTASPSTGPADTPRARRRETR